MLQEDVDKPMNANLNSTGILKITPETELEAYALKKWFDEYMSGEKPCQSVLEVQNIIIDIPSLNENKALDV